jgi:hypothetical protein
MSGQSWFELHHLWYTSVVTVALQAATAWWMLSIQVRAKLGEPEDGVVPLTAG